MSYRILKPQNRNGIRFLNTINKIRSFFREEQVACIPCVENPCNILFSTKKMMSHKIQIIDIKHKNAFGLKEDRHGIKFNGGQTKQMRLLADHLRTKVLPESNCVLLPKAFTNFFNSNEIDKYINSKFRSLEHQIAVETAANNS